MTKKHALKVFAILFAIISVSLLFSMLFNNVIYPAHVSVSSVCFPQHFEEEFSQYESAGETRYNVSSGETTIIINPKYEENIIVKQHEGIHLNQIDKRGWRPRCSVIWTMYIAEFEAYAFDGLPERVWEFVYG